jgi:N-acyl-D-aspartate/D-glutamate deacylase
MSSWDTLIKNALVFDGSGEAPVRKDIAVRDGRVVAAGLDLDAGQATHLVDATDLYLLPGLVDVHTHFDLEVEVAPGLPEAVRHGTTTAVVANCSLGLAFGNQRRDGQDPIVDCFARVENIPKPVLRKVADRATWSDSADYLAHLDELPLGPNIVPMIPYSMLRIEAMGLQASVERDPDPVERERMRELLEKGMREGYAGFSTDALPFHYLANAPNTRKPIPSQFGSYRELKQLTDVVRRHDRVWQATPPKDRPLNIFRLFGLTSGRLFGRPLRVTAVAALDVASNRGLLRLGRLLSRALNSRLLRGHFRLQALAAPFKTWAEGPITPLAEEIPPLRRLNEPDLEDRDARDQIMASAEWQQAFLAMWRDGKSGWSLARVKRLLRLEDYAITRRLEDMYVERSPVAAWQGMALAEVWQRVRDHRNGVLVDAGPAEVEALDRFVEAQDDAEFMMRLLQVYDRELVWWTVSANRDPALTSELLFDPLLLPGFNDSGAHLTNMAFYDGNLRALQAGLRRGQLAFSRMVQRLTREPADFFGIDIGGVRIGQRADLVLLDPQALAAYDSDAGVRWIHRDVFEAEQLVNRSDGVVRGVWIGGHQAWDGERCTPALGHEAMGRALRARNHGGEKRPTAPPAAARAA